MKFQIPPFITNRYIYLYVILFLSILLLRFSYNSSSFYSSKRILSTSNVKKACEHADSDPYEQTLGNNKNQDIYDMVLSTRGGSNRLKNLLNSNKKPTDDELKDYGLSFLTVAIPIGFFAILSLFGYICYCCCCCFRCCPICCKRNYNAHPIEKKEIKCSGILAFLMLLGIIAAGIAGLVYNEKFTSGYGNVSCSLATTSNNLIYGINTNRTENTIINSSKIKDQLFFLGTITAFDKLNSIVDNFNVSITVIKQTFDQTDWLGQDESKIKSQIEKIYDNNKDKTINTPDPRVISSTKKITPVFVQNLGPSTLSITKTGLLKTEYETTTVAVSESLKNIKSNSETLVKESSSVFNSLYSGKNNIGDLKKSSLDFDDQSSKLTDNSEEIFLIIYYVILGLFSFSLLFSSIAILSCFLSICCNMKKFRYGLHLSWFMLSIYATIILFISIILVPGGILMIEGCDTISEAFSNQKNFDQYDAIIEKDLASKLKVCLFDDGDFNKLFNMTEPLDQINKLSESFNDNPSTSGLTGSLVAQNHLEEINNYLNYTVISNQPSNNYENASFLINDLNTWSDYSVTNNKQNSQGNCQVTQDNFVFDSANCAYSKKYVKTLAADQDIGNKLCIDVSDIGENPNLRTKTYFSGCNPIINNEIGVSVSQIYEREVSQLYKYKTDLNSVFNNLKTDITQYKTLYNDYQRKLLSLNEEARISMKKSINTVLDGVSNKNTGIIAGLNCTFFKASSNSFISSTCYSFAPAFLQLVIIFVISGGFAMFAAYGIVVIALKLKRMEEKDNEDNYQNANEGIPNRNSNQRL